MAPRSQGAFPMASHRIPGRSAAISLVLFALTATRAWAGPLPELDVTAGTHPAASMRALAARARSSAPLLRVATPASYDDRYEVPTFLWATRNPGGSTLALRPLRSS